MFDMCALGKHPFWNWPADEKESGGCMEWIWWNIIIIRAEAKVACLKSTGPIRGWDLSTYSDIIVSGWRIVGGGRRWLKLTHRSIHLPLLLKEGFQNIIESVVMQVFQAHSIPLSNGIDITWGWCLLNNWIELQSMICWLWTEEATMLKTIPLLFN